MRLDRPQPRMPSLDYRSRPAREFAQLRGPGFDEEPFQRFAIGRMDELHRHQSIQERVLGEVDVVLPAFAERPEQPVLVEFDGRDGREGKRRRSWW